jgi:hypothetical protein
MLLLDTFDKLIAAILYFRFTICCVRAPNVQNKNDYYDDNNNNSNNDDNSLSHKWPYVSTAVLRHKSLALWKTGDSNWLFCCSTSLSQLLERHMLLAKADSRQTVGKMMAQTSLQTFRAAYYIKHAHRFVARWRARVDACRLLSISIRQISAALF